MFAAQLLHAACCRSIEGWPLQQLRKGRLVTADLPLNRIASL